MLHLLIIVVEKEMELEEKGETVDYSDLYLAKLKIGVLLQMGTFDYKHWKNKGEKRERQS